jgi:uncharacterized membrane protein
MDNTKPLFMKSIFVILLLVLITYALADGIRTGSMLGIILAICSLLALSTALYLLKKQVENNTEEEPV